LGNYTQKKQNAPLYDVVETIIMVNGKRSSKRIQFYDKRNNIIRRVGFTLDDEMDSTWTTFHRNGELIRAEYYKNGKLIDVK
jgi:antitoxin component YwqK of YwqJK toxin-antitoxin module